MDEGKLVLPKKVYFFNGVKMFRFFFNLKFSLHVQLTKLGIAPQKILVWDVFMRKFFPSSFFLAWPRHIDNGDPPESWRSHCSVLMRSPGAVRPMFTQQVWIITKNSSMLILCCTTLNYLTLCVNWSLPLNLCVK